MRTILACLFAVSISAASLGQVPGVPPGSERIDPPPRIPEITNPRKPFPVMVGDPAPGFDIPDWILGEPIRAFEPGKVYLIHLWSIWCDQCTSIMPRLTELQNQYADEGLVIIGATSPGRINTREAVTQFVFGSKTPVGYSIAWDRTRLTLDSWLNATGRTSVPCIFIVDRDGRIAFIGGQAEFEQPLRNIIEGDYDLAVETNQYHACISATWAFTHFEQKLKLKDWPGAFNLGREIIDGRGNNCHSVLSNMAWTLVDPANPLEVTDLELALKAARRADELTNGKDADTIDTLARVFYLKGDYAKAVEMEERAILVARSDALRAPLQKNLEQYRAKLAAP